MRRCTSDTEAKGIRLAAPSLAPILLDGAGRGPIRMMTTPDSVLHQAGVLAYRVEGGELQVLLVTSRDTGRWVIPKGNIDPGHTPAQAAAREAYEEAGIKGRIKGSLPLGFFTCFKRVGEGRSQATTIEVYPMRVDRLVRKWPERGQRTLTWFEASAAARAVDEPGLAQLILRLAEIRAPA
jgi:8-oxo-dGTP pyrophosphatase MutT (NUDIX family)